MLKKMENESRQSEFVFVDSMSRIFFLSNENIIFVSDQVEKENCSSLFDFVSFRLNEIPEKS